MSGYSYKSKREDSLDRLIDIKTGGIIKLDTYGSRGLDWNNAGTTLALADLEGDVHIYSSEGKHIRSFPSGNPRSLTGISWHPSDTILAVIGDDIRLLSAGSKPIQQINHSFISKLLLGINCHPSGPIKDLTSSHDTRLGFSEARWTVFMRIQILSFSEAKTGCSSFSFLDKLKTA